MMALVDCNSFFASCERVFNPKLRGKPVVVLSSNDGCVVARSDEAKAIGIPMGIPLFKIQSLVKSRSVNVLSSNFALYGDMSARVMQTLAEFTPDIEIYSIDEAFLSLTGMSSNNLLFYAQKIKADIYQYTGIPVSIGIAPTKVLAKAANRIAKKDKTLGGVFDLSSSLVQDEALSSFLVGDIWGIGGKSVPKLHAIGIKTAKQFRDAEPAFIRKSMGVVFSRIQEELAGVSCLDLEDGPLANDQIICSRSFGNPLMDKTPLKEAIATFVTRASERLRSQKQVCSRLMVHIQTDRFKTERYFNVETVSLSQETSATNTLILAALEAFERIYRPGLAYKKAGVILLGTRSAHEAQLSLFENQTPPENEILIRTLDHINQKMGRDSVSFAACGTAKSWRPRSAKHTPCYTTCWDDLIVAK